MGEDDFLLDATITIDGKEVSVSDLAFDINEDYLSGEDNLEDVSSGSISVSLQLSKKSIKALLAFVGSLIYKPSRLRSAIGLKRRKVYGKKKRNL